MELLVFSHIKLSHMSSNFSILFLHFLFWLINDLFLSQYHTVFLIFSLEDFEKHHGVQSPSSTAAPLLRLISDTQPCCRNGRRFSPWALTPLRLCVLFPGPEDQPPHPHKKWLLFTSGCLHLSPCLTICHMLSLWVFLSIYAYAI